MNDSCSICQRALRIAQLSSIWIINQTSKCTSIRTGTCERRTRDDAGSTSEAKQFPRLFSTFPIHAVQPALQSARKFPSDNHRLRRKGRQLVQSGRKEACFHREKSSDALARQERVSSKSPKPKNKRITVVGSGVATSCPDWSPVNEPSTASKEDTKKSPSWSGPHEALKEHRLPPP